MRSEVLTIIGIILLGLNSGFVYTYFSTPDEVTNDSLKKFQYFGYTTTFNILFLLLSTYGIFQSKKSVKKQYYLAFFLLSIIVLEMYLTFNKPSDNDTLREFFLVLLALTNFIKLYVLITLHADVTGPSSRNLIKTFKLPEYSFSNVSGKYSVPKEESQPQPKPQPQPRPQPQPQPQPKEEPKEVDIQGAKKMLNYLLGKLPTDFDPDEKIMIKERIEKSVSSEDPWQDSNNTLTMLLSKVPIDDVEKNDFRRRLREYFGKPEKKGGRRR